MITAPLISPLVSGLTGGLVRGGGSVQPELGYLAYVGSSSAFNSGRWDVGANVRVLYGDGFSNWALWRLGGGVTLLRNANNSDAFHFGQSGASPTQLLSAGTGMVDRAIAAAVAAYDATGKQTAIIAQILLNGIGLEESVPTLHGYTEDLIERCLAAGKAVQLVIPKAWPRLSTEMNAAARLALRLGVNEMLETTCAEYGVPLSETADVGDNGSGYILSTWSDAVAPGHGAMPFASRVGNLIYQDLIAHCKVPEFDLWNYRDAAVQGKNFELAGTGGSGGRPTGWSTGNNGSSTHTWSTVDYGDGSGRKWMRLVCAANGSNGNVQLSWSSGQTTGFSNGSVIEHLCEIRFPDPSGFDIGAVNLTAFHGGTFASPSAGSPRVTMQTPPVGIEYHPDKLVLRCMPTAATGSTTSFDLRVQISGSGTVDVGTPMAFIDNTNLPQYFP